MVFSAIDLDHLKSLGKHGPTFASQQIAAPLVDDALDTFRRRWIVPLEMLEIQHERATVFGRDFCRPGARQRQCSFGVRADLENHLDWHASGRPLGPLDPASLAVVQWHAVATLLRTLAGLVWLKTRESPRAEIRRSFRGPGGRPLAGVAVRF